MFCDMKRWIFIVLFVFTGSPLLIFAQPADSPEDADVTPVTGDMAPWRDFGVDAMNFDSVWAIALNNGNVAVFKRGSDFQTPGVVGGTEFLLFSPTGELITPQPIHGSYDADGEPTPWVDFAGTGVSWGGFTLGAHADRANGSGFVVHNQGENAETFDLDHADIVGDEAFSMVQLFNNDGTPIGSNINAFGSITAAPGEYRDVGAAILSNGNILVIGEDRQQSDELLDQVGANAGEVTIAVILGPDGSTVVDPFVVHTDEDGNYLGGSSSCVYQNLTAFEGGFVIDYGAGIRWYNNDGTPITPVQADHAELTDVEATELLPGLFIGSNTGGRGDNMALASNGKDLVVKSSRISDGLDSVGVLIYYNTDGTVKHWVRFDDVDLENEIGQLDRTFCDMDENGNVFVVWEDKRFGGASEDGHSQVFGRFFDKDGEPYGPSFPVYENWRSEPEFVDYGGSIGQVPVGDLNQPRCALNGKVAVAISASSIMPNIPDTLKQLSSAFSLVLNEAVVRIFENPLVEDTPINEWSVY